MAKFRRRPYANYISRGIRLGRRVLNAYRVARSYTQTMRRRRTEDDGAGVTSQFDRNRQYKYRRLGGRTRRRVVKRYKQFEYLADKQLATQTVVRNSTVSATVEGTGQGVWASHLYPLAGAASGAAESGCDDLWQIFSNDLGTADRGTYLHFTNAIMDVTIRNSGLTTCEVDVYHYKIKKRGVVDSFQNFTTLVNDAQSDTATIGLGAALTLGNRGATPFEFPILCSYVKIIKKTKYLIGSGQAITYQLKQRKNRRFNSEEILDFDPTLRPKFNYWATEGTIIVAKAVTGLSDFSLDVGTTRTYRYVKKQLAKVQDCVI